jgi:hypothetical protein
MLSLPLFARVSIGEVEKSSCPTLLGRRLEYEAGQAGPKHPGETD